MSDPNEKRTVNLTAYEFQTLLSLVSMERANELLDEMRVSFGRERAQPNETRQ